MSAPILKVDITANAKQLEAALNKAKAKVEELGAQIKSLPTGDKQFNKLANELARSESVYQRLANGYNKLGVESEKVAPKFEQVGNSSKSARTALTSLSLTIQDLPFGFIGIQNNLPGIIQGFGNLTTTTNGKVLPALKEIGKSLIGPAGIFLAFSAVTSIITVLIKNYGSLGGAIDALTGKQSSLNTQIRKFNEEYEKFSQNQKSIVRLTQDAAAEQKGQTTIVDSYIKRLDKQNLSQKEQKNIYEELKNVSQDFFGNLKAGKSTIEDVRLAADKYNKVLEARAKIQTLKNEINANSVLIEENKKLLKSQEDLLNVEKQRKTVVDIPAAAGEEALGSFFSQIKVVKLNAKELENLRTQNVKLEATIKEATKGIDAQTSIISQNSSQFQKATEDVKKYFEAYKPPKEYLDFFRLFDDKSKFQRGQELFQDLGNIDFTKGANSVTKFNEVIETLKQDFPNLFEGFGVSSAEEIPKQFVVVRKILRQALDNLALGIVADGETSQINKLGGKLADAYFDITDAFTKKIDKSKGKVFQEVKKLQDGFFDELDPENYIPPEEIKKLIAPFDLGDLNKGLPDFNNFSKKIIKLQDDAKKATLSFVQDIRDTANILNDVFFNPLQDQFTKLIETGKFSFREFGKAVLDNMKQLAAKLVATGIITLLATIASGGFSAATQLKTGLTGFQLFGRAFAGQLGFGPQRGPNLANIGAGGLAMSGAVNLTLRGSDLVGALNRTNTNINRIG